MHGRHAQFNRKSAIFGLQIGSFQGRSFPTAGQGERRRWVRGCRDGRLEMRDATLDDSGKYTCVGRNVLGTGNKTAILTVQGKFHFLFNS